MTRLLSLGLAILLLNSAAGANAATAEILVIKFGAGATVSITSDKKHSQARYIDAQDTRAKISIDKKLDATLHNSYPLRFLAASPGTAAKLAIVISSEESRKSMGLGFCGAGHEDFALLIEERDHILYLKDKYRLQSCLESQELDMDDPEDIRSGLKVDASHFSLSFRLLGDPENQRTVLSVKNGKFEKTVRMD